MSIDQQQRTESTRYFEIRNQNLDEGRIEEAEANNQNTADESAEVEKNLQALFNESANVIIRESVMQRSIEVTQELHKAKEALQLLLQSYERASAV